MIKENINVLMKNFLMQKRACPTLFLDLTTWSDLKKVSKNSSRALFTKCLLGMYICDPKKLNSLTSAFSIVN